MKKLLKTILRARRNIDLRKPMHALVIGVIVGGLAVPVLSSLAAEQRYKLSSSQAEVMAKISPAISGKLVYDDTQKVNYYNRDGQVQAADALSSKVGAGGKKSEAAYSAKMPVKSGAGIRVNSASSGVAVTMTPKFETLDGRIAAGRVVYPLKDSPGVLAITPKANGLKEDILLTHPDGDRLEFAYELAVPDGLEAKLLADGGVGFYSGDPALYGNINYASDSDRTSVELARKNSPKTYLMFEIPAPIVKQADGQKHGVKARFTLDGKRLGVITNGLAKASYPLSIDPTFVITSASDFNLGAAEDNIDFSTAGQIGRSLITGGTVGTWTSTSSLPTITDYNFGLTAYNNNLYLVGGGNGANTYAYYVPINSDGTLGTWTATTNFNTGRTGAGVVGWNGYVYIMGGEDANGNNQWSSVEYSKVQSDGSLGTWTTLTSTPMTVGRGYPAATVYKGVIYVAGGQGTKNNGTLRSTVEYSKIKSDGTLGSWATTTSFTTARNHTGIAAYNGFVYLTGGFNGSAALSDVQYAPINTDGTLGTWAATASMTTLRRSLAMSVERGYLYAYGGCTTALACSGFIATSEYAPINADGTVGTWTSTTSFTTARDALGGASNNGVLYLVGGCIGESGQSGNCSSSVGDSQYAIIDSPGNVTAPAATTSVGTARGGNAVTAYNGYLYSAGGCTGATCSSSQSTTVELAAINDDGTLGTWTTTGMTVLPAARYGGALAAFNGKLYYCGGDAGGTIKNDCLSSTLSASAGTNGAWTIETNTFDTNGRKLLSLGVWNNYLYVIGGTDNTTWYNTVRYSLIGTSGALGTFSSTTSTFTTGRAAHGSAIYGGNLYVVGGEDSGGSKLTSVQRANIDANGNISGGFTADQALPAGRSYASVVANNSVLYVLGGMTSTTATNAVLWAKMEASTAQINTWNTSVQTLVTSRQNFGAAAYKGYLYAVGGCTSGQACSTYTATSDRMRALNGGVGQTNAYATPTAFTTARADPQYAVLNGYLYIIGGCTAYTAGACTTWTTSVQSAPINPGGGLGTWTANTALAAGRSYGGAVVYNGFLYLIGGSVSGTAEDTTVLTATANSSGTLTWVNNSANYLPSGKGRNGFGVAVSGGYIYAVGGTNASAVKAEVYYSKTNSDGTLGDPNSCGGGTAWCINTAFTTARKDSSVAAYNSVLYMVGGTDGSGNVLSDTQYATIGSSGTLGTWKNTTRSDRGMTARQVVAGNGYMYFLGDNTTGTDVMYSAINFNNTLGNLYKTVAMPAVHQNGGAVFYNGVIYGFGGCTAFSSGNCTAVSAAIHSAGQQASARVAHYSKLFDTQIDTAPSQFQLNGALASGGSAIIASLQTASTSDPVLGVAQNINPALPGVNNVIQALNSSGSNVGIAFNYFVFLTLDDSGSGTFPDVSSNVTDFTIFYHANPGRRLRHGASFTNTGCNTTPSEGCILDSAP